MNPQATILSARIDTELSGLTTVVDRALQAWDNLEGTFRLASEELTLFGDFLKTLDG